MDDRAGGEARRFVFLRIFRAAPGDITELQLERLRARLAERKLSLVLTDAAKEVLAEAVLVTVKSGALTVVYADDRSCQGTTYTAGQSFIDFGNVKVHTALNRGSVTVDFWATYFVPGGPGAAFRVDAPSPGSCPF